MSKATRTADPNTPLTPQQIAGKARQAQLRAQLGEQGYRDLQRDKAHASIAAQVEAGTYTANRRAGYDALVERYGADQAQQIVRQAGEARRQWRLINPTIGELAVRQALSALGFTVRLTSQPFDYQSWWNGTDPVWADLDHTTALVEAYVGSSIVDVLLPHT